MANEQSEPGRSLEHLAKPVANQMRSEEDLIAETQARLAYELHGSLAQDLAAIHMRMSVWQYLVADDPQKMAEEIQSLKLLLEESNGLLKRLIYVLRPMPADDLDFFSALRTFVDSFAEQNRLQAEVQIAGEEACLPETVEKILWRALRESLHNIARHACAKSVVVRLDLRSPEEVLLMVKDDGKGFNSAILNDGSGFRCPGLKALRERLLSLGGMFQLDTRPGEGTELKVILPRMGL